METARLVAFAFGVYVSGAIFALAARRLWLRWNLDAWEFLARGATWLRSLGGARPRSPAAAAPPPVAAPAPAAPMLADLTEALADPVQKPSVAVLDDAVVDATPLETSAGDPEVDDLLAAWLPEDPDDTPADPAGEGDIGKAAAEVASEGPGEVPGADPEAVSQELARAHRNALELALSEIRPLEEKLGFLARHVRRLEAELGSRAASAAESSQLHFARELLVQQAELAAVERRNLVDELARERAQRELEVRAEGRRWSATARRLVELDGHLEQMAAALGAAASAGAAREQQLEEAQSLVRAERDIADRIRGLLASFQPRD